MNITGLTICVLMFCVSPATAWSVDLTPSQDNTIFQNSTTVSSGGQIGIFVGANNSANPARRGLIQFDVAGGIPAGVTIVDASLTLTLETANNAIARQISLYRLNTAWGEGTAGAGMTLSGAGYPVADGDATWTEAKHNQVNWTAGGDITTPASATLSVAGNTVNTTYTWTSAGLLIDVKDWYANPAANFGWDLINADEGITQSVKVFYSREFAGNTAFWPKLTITYVPEPTGDYNGNGAVDAADYVVWRKNFGQSAYPAGSGADGNHSGDIDMGDLGYWKAHFGNVVGSPGFTASVPEHSTCALCGVASLLVFFLRKR